MPDTALLDQLLAISDDELAQLPTPDQRWVAESIERELLLRSPADFAAGLSHGLWQPYRHLVHTSDAIVGMIEDDDCDILLIEQSVRHGKTELCSRWTPSWAINKFRIPVLLASYEADFAATHGRRVREIVKEHGPRFGVEINDQSRASNRWELVGGGGMGTAGAGGPITGKGGKLLIVDDPIKNSDEANSPVMREKLWEWWQSTFLTRREPGAKVIVIMSRWHEDDLIGRILKMGAEGARVKRVRLPAIAEDDDPLGRKPGEALCPERYDEQALAGIRSDVGPTSWAALYQQRPTPVGGGMFRRQWFVDHPYTVETANDKTWYRLGSVDDEGGHLVDADEMFRFCTMDTAYTRNQRSDYTALATWAVVPTDPTGLVLLDMERVRVTHNDHAPLVRRVWEQWKPAWVGVEKMSANLSMFDEVQRSGVVVRWLTPDKNKVARAETATAMVESGRIWFPTSATWFADFLDEVLTFPVGKHDDMVDTLSYAANELSKRTVRAHRRRAQEPETPGDRMWERLRQRQKANTHHPILGRLP